ncbi:NDR1/HIN1-like protein 6 [Malania oleifera]|uniref:NDR1/HIN1-like protein 6 n=1 Tax=Malania oleifera TaxID=397392 RepID=UPI0025ADE7DF|nr:NDR1/HIN1-like protein 6 [Malania oleifera]
MEVRQKIHPLPGDAEAPPTAPLVPPGSFQSEKGDPVNPPKPRSCSCCKCLCWTIGLLVLLLVIAGATGGILYLVFRPKLPNYSISSLKITDLRLNYDMSLFTEFEVKIKAYNPNRRIGIYYEEGGKLSVWYQQTNLCGGLLPNFYQGHGNTTVLSVVLTGETQYGSGLMAMMQQQQQTGDVPLDLKVDVPVAIKLGRLKLRKVRFLVGCMLAVDSLAANNLITIRASNCGFRPKL